jgi:RNA polymerase sigma factor (TIGR02999 family)
MNDVTRILSLIDEGDSKASEQLLTLVYDELRRLAAARLAEEKPGQTLQATALVHEAYLSLVGSDTIPAWDSRGHFFAAAAEAMRRILVDRARRKKTIKRGGDRVRVDLVEHDLMVTAAVEEVLAVDEILERLGEEDSLACAVLKLKYYAGMSVDDAASALGISRATAYRHWTYARAYVRSVLLTDDSDRKN